jgi:OOP family OmpA-OmpF porin
VFEAVALFDFDKANLKPQGKEQINKYREEAKDQLASVEKIKVTGYTDSIGSVAYNKKLSLRRAEAVRKYLVSLGVDPNKMEVAGMGKSNPVASNKTKEGRAKNRRVEVVLTGLGK